MTAATGHDTRLVERLRAALAFAGVGAWEWDLRTGEAWWSDHLYAILGRSPATTPTTLASFLDCVLEEDREPLRVALREVLRTGEPRAFVCRVLRPDGSLRVCRGQLGGVQDEAGSCRLIHGALRNTTLEDVVRHNPDDSIERGLNELLTLVEAAPNPLLLVDSMQRILRVNHATEEMFGWRSGDLVGRDLETLFLEPSEMLDALLVSATARIPAGRLTRSVSVISRDGWSFAADMTVVATPATDGAQFAVTFAPGVMATVPTRGVEQSPWFGLNSPRVDAPATPR